MVNATDFCGSRFSRGARKIARLFRDQKDVLEDLVEIPSNIPDAYIYLC